MREIKFRAWELGARAMVDVTSLSFNNVRSLEYPMNVGDAKIKFRDDGSEIGLTGGYILMQYTGLKDKNGVEIYEGDYLKVEGLYVEVLWSDFDAGFVFEDSSGSQMVVTSGNSRLWEVIGNIYENKELL